MPRITRKRIFTVHGGQNQLSAWFQNSVSFLNEGIIIFNKEAHRVLKTGGKLILTTVNRKYSLSRNPWHVREYLASELRNLILKHFANIETKGVHGNKKVMDYYEKNKRSVEKITRFDIFNLQYRLPRWMLQVPYDIANRMSRNIIQKSDNQLVTGITHEDYFLNNDAEECFDFFYIATK